MTAAFFPGFALGFSLILAIGAQNAFVLRQGLRRAHVFAVCLTCAVSDAVLITLGVTSFAVVAEALPWLAPAFRYGGAAFLIVYGARAFLAAWRGADALQAGRSGAGSLRATVLTCLALTWLNPHVYLDTVMLLGSVSTQYGDAAAWFGAGAVASSFVFFFGLGYGARLLAPFFARPRAWQILDLLVGMVMWAIAAKLIFLL
ncbi:LysE/ArgO family amino acid transporter [Rhodophyticola porphyridii]|uniref:Amino acid transporter n=1 Tax=Rhodophyticola porphyridii TaxID=1852017 RepID=A0A3L9XYN3_9RHOB|nr:LysE/ArgO family amino acid transporter [Rhodophyticola porphyridii]RMA41634.1 amino acid transporter [Rhodophyticola porphyridii]